MSQNMNVINQVYTVGDALAQTQAAQPAVPAFAGPSGEQLVSELHGRYYNANYRNHLFMATASGVTLPVVASGVASVFTLFNPVNSGKNLIVLRAAIGTVLATTVVDLAGLYYLVNPTNASTTAGTIKSGMLSQSAPSVANFFTACTHTSQTPTLAANVGGMGAVTDASANFFSRDFEGSIIVPPNVSVDFLMSTAASTASGVAVELTWMEAPI